ncbi:MAG: hypothetical protein GY699_11010 [Desulfobacteraceae bacterium]|nr:hypothetical protein [Desulfobacteraceae bacterium]
MKHLKKFLNAYDLVKIKNYKPTMEKQYFSTNGINETFHRRLFKASGHNKNIFGILKEEEITNPDFSVECENNDT